MKGARKVIGLMSGTSADGVDAALVTVSGSGLETSVELLGFAFLPYPPELRAAVLRASDVQTGRVDEVCRMHVVLGEWFAKAALKVCRRAGIGIEEVDLIGSHGQTVHHLPEPVAAFGEVVRGTLQLGDPSVIAERTGVTTVADFRSRDMAAGGQGAPLVPLADYLLFRSEAVGRVLLNIGGIANLTLLPAACSVEAVTAFDTGPGNMAIDALAGAFSGGEKAFDEGGAMAASGEVHEGLLEEMMRHPFLGVPPPKSTGREAFGEPLVKAVLRWRGRVPDADLMRTATAFTARSIADAIGRYILPSCEVREVVVSGGGAENPVLMALLGAALPEMEVVRIDALGVPSAAKEAVCFAVLANETAAGRPGNVPRATGAAHPVVLGVVAPGRRCRISVDSSGEIV